MSDDRSATPPRTPTELSAEDQLRQTQRLESLSLLAGGLAHDFNNLLTVIIGAGEIIEQSIPEGHPAAEAVRELQDAATRATELTRQLLAFSGKRTLRPVRVDVNEVVQRSRQTMDRLLGDGIALECVIADQPLVVMADPGEIEQILVNLTVNARDAMPEGGRLMIRTDLFALRRREAAGGEPAAERYVRVVVRDTGIGMDAETRSRVFEPFFTTKNRGQSTGLGLAAVYGIVRRSNGFIQVESAPGAGSTFTVLLPEWSAAAATSVDPEAVAARGGKEAVLIVEDDVSVRRIAELLLLGQGYSVTAVTSSTEALTQLRSGSLRPDLLVTDIVMPGLSGPDLARHAQALLPDLRVLFMTGYADDEVLRDTPSARRAHLVMKPFSREEFSRAVRGALDS